MMVYEDTQNMMNWMTSGMWGFGLLAVVIEVLVVIVLALLTIYLWKQIQKK